MEQQFETIEVDSEENNELLFRVKVEGASQKNTKTRLVCEDENVSFMFNGTVDSSGEDLVQFNIPPMKNKITEGTYLARVEVLVENRYFEPVQFKIKFKKSISVMAEVVTRQKLIQRTIPVSVTVENVQPKIEKKIPQTTTPSASPTLKERFVSKKPQMNEQEILARAEAKLKQKRH